MRGRENMVYKMTKTIAVLGLLMLIPASLFGQMTARSMGMGGAYMGVARGVHAPSWNPANLGLPDNPGFSFSILSLGAEVGNNSFSMGTYNRFAFDEFWDEYEIEELLNQIPDDGLGVDINAEVRTLSFSSGRFALTLHAIQGVRVNLDKDFIEFPLKGNVMDKTYHFQNIEAYGSSIGKIGLSYGSPISVEFADIFAVGGTVNILYGLFASEIEYADFKLTTKPNGFVINGEYQARYGALGGTGFGLDIGAAAQFNSGWSLGMSLMNLVGSVPFKDNNETVWGQFIADTLTVLDFSDEDAFQDTTWENEDSESFSQKLPTVLRIGGSYQEGNVLLSLDYIQGFNNSTNSSAKPQLAFGTEYQAVKWLPLRMGVIMGGRRGLGTSLGFGLRPGGFALDFGILNRGFITSNSSKGWVFSLEMGVGLN